ncbi:MAG: hypothetical protein ABIY70_26140 [Capsulimonas sp.]|uniref:hypothetical protein n=1 Tax=Capsulimonas sp. TaxID=2494211 RepID=UPI003265D432
MTLTRKRAGRRIFVREQNYVWRLNNIGDGTTYFLVASSTRPDAPMRSTAFYDLLQLQVFPAEHLGNQLFAEMSITMLESAWGACAITPKLVACLIEGALDVGWSPSKNGLTLDVAEAQEILEAYVKAKPACQES